MEYKIEAHFDDGTVEDWFTESRNEMERIANEFEAMGTEDNPVIVTITDENGEVEQW